MQGAPPLASPGLSPSGTGNRGEPLAQRGACPVGCRLTLPPLYLPGGVLSLSPACPAFSLLPCPLSPSPFPNGEGEIYGYFMQGAPPLASPAFNRLRHLQSLPYRSPTGWRAFFNPDSRRPSGCQRSIQHRKKRFSTSKTSAASRPALGDARGGAPCIRKQKIAPFPGGEERSASAGGGMGATKQAKGRVGKRQRRQAPRRGRQGQVEPSARRQMRKLSKQPQQQHLELHLL